MGSHIKLTVFFDGTFWMGLFEKVCEEKYEVSKVVFGSEPKDYEVYDFLSENFYNLKFFSSSNTEIVQEKRINPKRLQREIKRETESQGIGTKAQIAMKMQHEASKTERKIIASEKKTQEKERQFELRQIKKKEKHKGH